MVESLKQQQKDTEKSHLEELKRTKDGLTSQLEEKWKERLKYVCTCRRMHISKFSLVIYRQECGSLRQELSQRHSEDSSTALKELAKLKDDVMKQAKQRWEEERSRLLKKVMYSHSSFYTLVHSNLACLLYRLKS